MGISLATGGPLFTVGLLIGGPFKDQFLSGTGAGRIQSLLLAGLLMVVGFQMWLTLCRTRRLELEKCKTGADTRFTTLEAHQ